MPQVPVIGPDIGEPGRRQERLETALAYERMAERAKRHFGLAD